MNKFHLKSLTIPKFVTEIERGGLAKCNIESLDFEKDQELTSIGYHAFEGNNFKLVTPKTLKS